MHVRKKNRKRGFSWTPKSIFGELIRALALKRERTWEGISRDVWVSPAGLPVLWRESQWGWVSLVVYLCSVWEGISRDVWVLLVYLCSDWSLFWFYFSTVSFAGEDILFLRRFFLLPGTALSSWMITFILWGVFFCSWGALLFLDSRVTGRFRAVIVTGISFWKFLPYLWWKMEFATEKYKALLRVQVDSS